MTLCKYKDIFGKPNTGAHTFRVFDIAVVDVVVTFILALCIWFVIDKKKNIYNLVFIFVILIVISVPIHKLFCVDTKLASMF